VLHGYHALICSLRPSVEFTQYTTHCTLPHRHLVQQIWLSEGHVMACRPTDVHRDSLAACCRAASVILMVTWGPPAAFAGRIFVSLTPLDLYGMRDHVTVIEKCA